MRPRRRSLTFSAAVLVACALTAGPLLAGCGAAGASQVRRDQLIIATTTSLNDSGLLEGVVLPALARIEPDLTVKVVAVGSGEALAMGASGEADVLLVHSPADEERFMADGHGTLRLPFACNRFVVAGPDDDPAGVRGTPSAADALAAIAGAGAAFVSRGDGSGTHAKELELWRAAGVEPAGDWYLQTGQGMSESLRVADEKRAYILTDLGTLLALRGSLDLVALSAASDDVTNVYSVIIVNQNEIPAVNAAAAERLVQWLVSAEGQAAIGAYGTADHGQPLFTPCAGSQTMSESPGY